MCGRLGGGEGDARGIAGNGLEMGGGETHREGMASVGCRRAVQVQVHFSKCGEQGHGTGAAGRTWASVASVGCSREHRGERVFRGIRQIPGTGGYSGCWECGGQHRAAQCGVRAGQRRRQEIGELVRVRGREWASVVSEVVLEQGQEQQGQDQQGQEQQGSAEDAAQGAGGQQKSQAQVEREAQRRWWQEERRRVRRAKQAAEEAARRAKVMEQEAWKQDGVGLGWGSVLPLPRPEVGVAKAKAQVKGQEAAR